MMDKFDRFVHELLGWFFFAAVILSLVSCQTKTGGQADADPSTFPPPPAPTEIILYGAAALAAAGVLCFIGAFVAIVFLKNRGLAITLLTCAIGCIVMSPILWWVGENLWWIALVAGLLGLGAGFLLVRKNIKKIEAFLGVDLDRDGKIG
jgi:hypothetical protein